MVGGSHWRKLLPTIVFDNPLDLQGWGGFGPAGMTSFLTIVTGILHQPAGTDRFGLFCYIPGPDSENRCPKVDGGNHQNCYYLPQRKFAMLGAQLDAPDYLSHLRK